MQVWKRALVGLAALVATACSGGAPAPATGAMVMGQANAPVTIIEYASPTCPVCKTFHDDVLPTIKTKYLDTGKAKLVFREMPSHNPPVDVAIFQLARCAGADKYFAMMDDVYARQQEIDQAAHGASGARPGLLALGAKFGLSAERANECIANAEGMQRITDGARHASEVLGVNGTPSILVNDKLLSGFGVDTISAAVDAELAGK